MNPPKIPRLLLIDDDPAFGKIMTKLAQRFSVALTTCRSLADLGPLRGWTFDAALVDYHLESASGITAIRELERHFQDLPVILISQTYKAEEDESSWPGSIKDFCRKSGGLDSLLIAAVAVARQE